MLASPWRVISQFDLIASLLTMNTIMVSASIIRSTSGTVFHALSRYSNALSGMISNRIASIRGPTSAPIYSVMLLNWSAKKSASPIRTTIGARARLNANAVKKFTFFIQYIVLVFCHHRENNYIAVYVNIWLYFMFVLPVVDSVVQVWYWYEGHDAAKQESKNYCSCQSCPKLIFERERDDT